MQAHDLVMNFRQVLLDGYPAWERAATVALNADRGFLDEAFDDWAQANWELLVERPLCGVGEFLEIYSSGSDYEQQFFSRGANSLNRRAIDQSTRHRSPRRRRCRPARLDVRTFGRERELGSKIDHLLIMSS